MTETFSVREFLRRKSTVFYAFHILRFLMLVAVWLLLLYWRMPVANGNVTTEAFNPVYTWGMKIYRQLPSDVLSDLEFSNAWRPYLEKYTFGIFAENNLTTEDGNNCTIPIDKPGFLWLRRIENYAYFPQAAEPVATLNALWHGGNTYCRKTVDQLCSDLFYKPKTVHTKYPEIQQGNYVDELDLYDPSLINVTKSVFWSAIFFYMGDNRTDYNILERQILESVASDSTKAIPLECGLLVMSLICAIILGGICWIRDINAYLRLKRLMAKPHAIKVKK